MKKLRRHDWRSHRIIECNICSELLESRAEIKSHRQNEHQMYRKIFCKFYPDCVDGDECLFEHYNDEKRNPIFCTNGSNCSDQSCVFSEQDHRSLRHELCRYQVNCNRAGCPFVHNGSRNAFLGPSQSETRKK